MEGVFNPIPRSTVVPVRPKSVQFCDRLKSTSTLALSGHDYRTCEKHGPRDKPVLQQRYVGYPVCVPDLSKPAVEETMMRRQVHKELIEMTDGKAFRKYVFPTGAILHPFISISKIKL